MPARPGIRQASWNAGELDPAARASTHLKSYFAGAATMKRLQPIPQGGFTLMPGSRHRWRIPAAGLDPVRLHAFTYSQDVAYVMVLRPFAIDLMHGADGDFALSASVVTPYPASAIRAVQVRQRRDTALLFHPDFPTKRLRRLAVDTWAIDDAPFTDPPLVDLGGVYTPVGERWRFYVNYPTTGFVFGSQTLEFTVNGETTAAVNLNLADLPTSVAAIAGVIEALAGVEAGVAVTYIGSVLPGSETFEILFGGTNTGGNFDVTGRCVSSTQVALQFSRTVVGKRGGEPILSSTAGYPATGIFYQDRLIPAGFRAEPGAFCASRSGEYFDLNIEARADDAAFLIRMDTDAAERIATLARGRHLIIMTSEAEYFVADRALSAATPPNLVRSSGVGARPGVPVIEQEGSILFVNGSGAVVYAATYSDVAQAYQAQPISLLSSHLVQDVVDAALQRGAAATDADRYWLVRGDGGLVCGHLLRDQDVTGFTPWASDGALARAVCVDGAGTVWLATHRDGGLTIETLEDGLLFDDAMFVQALTPQTVFTGLDHLNGHQVWALADGWICGPYPVSGGALTLDEPATNVTVGRWTAPEMAPLAAPRNVADRVVLQRPTRVHTLRVEIADTTSLALGANGRPARDIALGRAGDLADVPTPPRSGEIVVAGLVGFAPETRATITQTRPGQLTVRALTMEARL